METQVEATYASRIKEAELLPSSYMMYCRWTTYPLGRTLGVLMVLVLRDFSRGEVRRRSLVAPEKNRSFSLSLVAAGVVTILLVWVWLSTQGIIAMGLDLSGVEFWHVGGCLFMLFGYAVFALSFGFLLAQCGTSEIMANAASNIVGLVLSFLGGAWMGISAMDQALVAVARFTPVYWYYQAIIGFTQTASPTFQDLAPSLGSVGLVFRFAEALFAVALSVGRLRISAPAMKAPWGTTHQPLP